MKGKLLMAIVPLLVIGVLAFPGLAAAQSPWVVTSDELYVRSEPHTAAPVVDTLAYGDSVQIVDWVKGEAVVGENATWAMLGPGQYVYTGKLRKPFPESPPPPPPDAVHPGAWIDVSVSEQIMTAYEGDTPLFWAVISTGRPGHLSPLGSFSVVKKVKDETMDSRTLDFTDDPYLLTGVLNTQYFTWFGHAIHYNYWKGAYSPFGVPTSHGCIGLQLSDSEWFWNFTTNGTPVEIHR